MRRLGARFAGDHSGATAVLFGMALPMLALCAGISVDMARWVYAQRQTAATLDSAVIAGARALQLKPDDIAGALAAATRFYQSNRSQHFAFESDTIQFTAADGNSAVTASGAAYLRTTFLNVIGITRLEVASSAGAGMPKASVAIGGNAASNLEVAVMLDVTGSMCADGAGPCTSDAKIQGLKDAAKELIDLVVASDQSRYTSKVALVPFSTRVRVGPDGGGGGLMKALTNLDPTWSGWYDQCTLGSGGGGSETAEAWNCLKHQVTSLSGLKVMPCVTDRYFDGSGYDLTDDAPGPGRWLNGHDGGRAPLGADSSDTTLTSGRGLTSSDPADFWNYDDAGGCADVQTGNQILPLTSDKAMLKSRVDALEAYGATAGALGTAWAWYMLSPNWSPALGSNARPYSELTTLQAGGAPVLRKVAILMTDGGYNTYRGWKDQDQQQVSNYARDLCAAMRAKGVEVFTVAFALNELPTPEQTIARATLSACGSDVHHFYETLTVQDLQVAFRDIGAQLTPLRLTF